MTAGETGDWWAERILYPRQICRLRGKRIFRVRVEAMSAFFTEASPDIV